jgi:hypothetical protein
MTFANKYFLKIFIPSIVIVLGFFYLGNTKEKVGAHFHFSNPEVEKQIEQLLNQYGISQELFDILSSPEHQFMHLQQMMSEVQSSLQVTTIPTHPGPREQVTVRIESFHTNLNAAQIGWFLNGRLQKSGIGDKSFTFTTGSLGETSRITVVINTIEGNIFERDIFINPSEMDIIWEAETYTPPFYRGKALNTHESDIRLTAMPVILSNGSRINPENLIYKWTIDGRVLNEQSGYGKNSITIENRTISRNIRVIAEATTLDGQTTVRERVDLSPVNPQVHLYNEHPRYGTIFERILAGEYLMSEPEMTIRGIPFFFSKNSMGSGDVAFSWRMNNLVTGASEGNQTFLTVRREDGTRGLSNISLRARNHGKTSQQAQNNFNLRFGN